MCCIVSYCCAFYTVVSIIQGLPGPKGIIVSFMYSTILSKLNIVFSRICCYNYTCNQIYFMLYLHNYRERMDHKETRVRRVKKE